MDPEGSQHPQVGWSVGDALTPLVIVPTRVELFMFSAITWNRHHVHFDHEAAEQDGLPGVVVHRGLVGDYLARMLADWAGDPAAIRSLSWRMHRSAVAGVALTCRGQITAHEQSADGETATCDVEAVNQAGDKIATGRATLVRRS